MRLATRRDGTRDGSLVVVGVDGASCASASSIATHLQGALERWDEVLPRLCALSEEMRLGKAKIEPLHPRDLLSPLPRIYEWVDGSAYLQHMLLVRKARGAAPPPNLENDPLVYQGGASVTLAPEEDMVLRDPGWGLDFEAEVCVILGDTPFGTSSSGASAHIRLLMLCNDITYRHLVPGELAKGFGFFQSKPATAFSPFAVTPDELGASYHNGRIHRPLQSSLNGQLVGDPDAGAEMHFSFFDLVEHITKTRAFGAGTVLGSGTVSNVDRARGVSCLAEKRMLEIIDSGSASTPFLQASDLVEIQMNDVAGRNVFGTIRQRVRSG